MGHSANSLPKQCWERFGVNSSRLFAVRVNSRIFRCTSASGELAVKCCVDAVTGQADLQGAQREYDALQRLNQAAIDAGVALRMPKPIGLLGEEGIVAMTWEVGEPMTGKLLSGGRPVGRQCGTAAGNWLRLFHQLHPLAPRKSDLRGKLDFITQALDQLKLASDQLLQRATRLLVTRRAGAEAVCLPVSWIFSDFKSDNLLMRGGEAVALDAQIQYENTVIHDIVPFLIHLELLRWSPRGLYRWKTLTQASDSFLAAYSTETDDWRLPIAWLTTEMLLQRGIATARATSLAGRVRNARIRTALARAVNKLDCS